MLNLQHNQTHRVHVSKYHTAKQVQSTFFSDNLYGNWFDMVITYWEYLKGKHNVFFIVYEDLKKVR